MVETSTLISIIYFSANIILLLALGYYVKKHGEYESIKSKAFIKDIWSQRKIYAPLIVHFYDTATDIGVVYYWYGLMIDETKKGIDYKSLDMKVFFWCGITFLLVYRVITLIVIILENSCKVFNFESDWYDVLLVLLDVYIFRAVYASFQDSSKVMSENAKIRKAKEAKKKNGDKKDEESGETTDQANTHMDVYADQDEIGIDINDLQLVLQFGEAITESMPQIMLQSVFVIRSYNDPKLSGANIWLIGLSILASLFSISSKFTTFDIDEFKEELRSLSPKLGFPNCVNYWYIILVIWRLCDVMSKFIIYVLMWTVLGGAWLPIWGVSIMIFNLIYYRITKDSDVGGDILIEVVISVAGVLIDKRYKEEPKNGKHVIKFIECCIGLSIVAIFAAASFDCGICASSDTRTFSNETNNKRISFYFVMGCGATFLEAILYIIMKKGNVWDLR